MDNSFSANFLIKQTKPVRDGVTRVPDKGAY